MIHAWTLQTAGTTAVGLATWIRAQGGFLTLTAGLAALVWRHSRRADLAVVEQGREQRMREELEAYLTLDLSQRQSPDIAEETPEQTRGLARRVCRTIANKSVFSRVSLLLRSPDGRLEIASSIGTDDLTVAALQSWGAQEEDKRGRWLEPASANGAALSFSIALGEWNRFDPEIASWALSGRKERRRWRRGIVTPVRNRAGHLLGALVVCADGARVDGSALAHTGEAWNGKRPASLERALAPMEALAARFGAALEANTTAERLLRAEKLAGVGQLAAGVAHALNNPLTAVLGFADLIAETTSDARIQKDAQTILAEAARMQATVRRLVDLAEPARLPDQTLDLSVLLAECADRCQATLAEQTIPLEREGLNTGVAAVFGSHDCLREVFEQLLNNAAQAIAVQRQQSANEKEKHMIRITLLHDAHTVRVLISDTGTGFAEPARAFDPFYTTRGPEQGAGLGLSICYGIVREHRGEIHACNREPHGATVVMEFPVWHKTSGANVLTGEEEMVSPAGTNSQTPHKERNDKIRGITTRAEVERTLTAGSTRWRSRDRRSGSR